MFLAKLDENDEVNCLSFFSLSDPKKLPEVVNLLINKDEERSTKFSALVDWFGVYSSPLKSDRATMCALYTRKKDIIPQLANLEQRFRTQFEEVRKDLLNAPEPRTVFRILNRHTVL